MKFTLSWLKDHLLTDADAADIAETLTRIGLEVESLENRAAALRPFIVGYVVSAEPHPDADRLKVCIVDTGREKCQVVCGAPNARAGMKGVFAPAGAYIPGTDLLLKSGVIRGQQSNGMLCSEREMGLSDEHDGIIELPEDAPVGASFAAVAGLDDPLFDVAITPNRGDCLGVRGIARDLAAAGMGTLKPLQIPDVPGAYQSPISWVREAAAEDSCPYVAGRHFRIERNAAAPAWLQDRLRSVGLRPISALVDITNYITHDLGRPLHVFDADKLRGKELRMSRAVGGERLRALDGREYELPAGATVIRDDNGVQGLGGIIGGEDSSCTEDTRTVFLEAALFDPLDIARTGRALNINTDARYRFERGVDPLSPDIGAAMASRMILDFCGGQASAPVSHGRLPATERRIGLRMSYLKKRIGVDVGIETAEGILQRLGFATVRQGDEAIEATVPSWRTDVEGEHCLLEEVLRIHGLDAAPAAPLERIDALPKPAITVKQRRIALAKKILAMRGAMEAVTFSFTAEKQALLFLPGATDAPEEMKLANPISAELSVMRPSILGNLAAAAARNADRGEADCALFEVGPVFAAQDGAVTQQTVAAALRTGAYSPRHWALRSRPADIFDAKADALAVLEGCGAPVDKLQTGNDAPAWYHPGRSGAFRLGPKLLARFGELHPEVCRALGLRGRACACEVFPDEIPLPRRQDAARGALKSSGLMPVTRDFAFLVAGDVAADDLLRAVVSADKALIADATLFDLYEGAELEGKKSIAVGVTLQPQGQTLTEAEITAVGDKIVAAVTKRTGGVLRGE